MISLPTRFLLVVSVTLCMPVIAWGQNAPQGESAASSQIVNFSAKNKVVKPEGFEAADVRVEREKLAPSVMSSRTEFASEREMVEFDNAVYSETVKRLRLVEQQRPVDALNQYRLFLTHGSLTPSVAVQAAIKVSQLRVALGDIKGALLTCDVMIKKYAFQPSCGLISLQRARILMGQNRLVEASKGAEDAMPALLALGPKFYLEVSDFLISLAGADIASGGKDEQQWARILYAHVEDIYLRWIKRDTIDHLWQRFEALKVDYQQAGDMENANALLPKVGDALLKMPPSPNDVERGVLLIEMAQWLSRPENVSPNDSIGPASLQSASLRGGPLQFYAKAGQNSNGTHAGGAIILGFGKELELDPKDAETQLLKLEADANTSEARLASRLLLTWDAYISHDWNQFLAQAAPTLKQYGELEKARRYNYAPLAFKIVEAEKWAAQWQTHPVVAEEHDIHLSFDEPLQESVERRIFVDTPTSTELEVTVEGSQNRVQARVETSAWAEELQEIRQQQVIIVTITPGSSQLQTTIVIRDLQHRNQAERVNILITPHNSEDPDSKLKGAV